jgi:hypothetical protein
MRNSCTSTSSTRVILDFGWKEYGDLVLLATNMLIKNALQLNLAPEPDMRAQVYGCPIPPMALVTV